jgi:hypothetical protein
MIPRNYGFLNDFFVPVPLDIKNGKKSIITVNGLFLASPKTITFNLARQCLLKKKKKKKKKKT